MVVNRRKVIRLSPQEARPGDSKRRPISRELCQRAPKPIDCDPVPASEGNNDDGFDVYRSAAISNRKRPFEVKGHVTISHSYYRSHEFPTLAT